MLCCAGLLPAAFATPPGDAGRARLHMASWAVRDGAPADIWAMAQGADGFLWLGTGTGLYRFDGVRFEQAVLPPGESFPSSNVTALKLLPDGSLWLGFYFGGAAVLKHGHLRNYGAAEGFPSGMVENFAVDDGGVLWAATDGGLARFAQGHWENVGEHWGYPTHRADWLLLDRTGTLWVVTGRRLMFLRKGAHRFEDTGEAVGGFATLARAPDGTLWISDGLHGTRALPGLSADQPHVARDSPLPRGDFGQAKRMMFDHAGHLWVTDADHGGVYRVDAPGRIADGRPLRPDDISDTFDRAGGLTSDRAVPLLEDSEGDVWVGTNLGLNSFRMNNVGSLEGIEITPAAHYALSVDSRGVLWLAYQGALYRIEHQAPRKVLDGLPDVADIYAAPDGSIWFQGRWGLKHILKNGQVEDEPLPEGTHDGDIAAMVSDGQGGVWVGLNNRGTYRYHHGRWQRWSPKGAPVPDVPAALATDARGRLWLGYVGNRLALLDGGHVRLFNSADGLGVGSVTAIAPFDKDTYIGGDAGLARYRDGHFVSLPASSHAVLQGISGIVKSADGSLWLNGSRGVVRIDAGALQHAFEHPLSALDYRLFDDHDGLPGVALQASATTTAMVDGDGQLWFATNQGVARIDPARVHRNPVPPPVTIRAVQVGGRSLAARADMRLPERTSNLRIEYTAASLAMPERVRFRYRLEGVDEQWQDAGDRREAFYTNLAPGDYRFRVIAANGDGVWNEQGTELRFHIPPLFYQTPWFVAACVLLGLLLLFGLFLLRLRQVAMRMHGRVEERHAERERIARELHDTLLQSIQGLVLHFQAVAEKIPPGDAVRTMIDRALDRADDVLMEGRDRVLGLRTSSEAIRDLPQAFALVGEDLAPDTVDFRVVVEGAGRALEPLVREELYRIGREALVNAIQHAHARQIEVEISYDTDQLRLRFRDNGVGIDPAILEAGGRPRHWGLDGMRERAERIGARLDIWCRTGSGTEVELRVPARAAYRGGRSSWLGWLRRIVSGGRYA